MTEDVKQERNIDLVRAELIDKMQDLAAGHREVAQLTIGLAEQVEKTREDVISGKSEPDTNSEYEIDEIMKSVNIQRALAMAQMKVSACSTDSIRLAMEYAQLRHDETCENCKNGKEHGQ